MAERDGDLHIRRVELGCARETLSPLARFYANVLGLPAMASPTSVAVSAGPAELVFSAAAARPLYHFAFLVPGDRFDAAHAAFGARVPLLADAAGETVFEFGFWDARACYFHDPAGNIVELIAHAGLSESGGRDGPFGPEELAGISEIGLITPAPAEVAGQLSGSLGLELWSGTVDGPDSLGFVGRQAHTLILARPGRPWLPTGRPAEAHPLAVTLSGEAERALKVAGAISVRRGGRRQGM
jgi:catechol 2,3-dioxygenase-like lactoylglutathione lyase family enzyme